MIFVVTQPQDPYDKPIAVRSDYVDAKNVAIGALESPGDNYKLESVEVRSIHEGSYQVHALYRNLILPKLEPASVWGPVIWGLEDHD